MIQTTRPNMPKALPKRASLDISQSSKSKFSPQKL